MRIRESKAGKKGGGGGGITDKFTDTNTKVDRYTYGEKDNKDIETEKTEKASDRDRRFYGQWYQTGSKGMFDPVGDGCGCGGGGCSGCGFGACSLL